MKILPLTAGAVLLCLVGTAYAQQNVSKSDAGFAKRAAAAGMAEVAEGKLASDKASSADVKQFAQTMVTDHTKANDQLMKIAQGKGVDLPSEPNKRDQAQANKLEKMSGPAFDKKYIADQVAAHKKVVAMFQRESERGKDADLKQFATDTLPTLQHHLEMAEQLQGGK